MGIYKIVDLSLLLPGPFATSLLDGELFNVVKIEDVKNPDPMRYMKPTRGGVSVAYQKINEGKEICMIDLRSDEGKSAIRDTIAESDIIIENFLSGKLKRLGFGFEDALRINKKIIYCSISGYGRNNPLSGTPAHDLNVLGYCGYLDSFPDSPRIPTLPLADIATSYTCALAIVQALLKGERGIRIDISMCASVQRAMGVIAEPQLFLKRKLSREENFLWGAYPCYRLYKTVDNRFMVLATLENVFWHDFCYGIGREDLHEHQFSTDNDTIAKLEEIIGAKSQSYWTAKGLPCFTPVLHICESKKLGYVS